LRVLLLLVLAIGPAVAQSPQVRLLNVSRPNTNFEAGDRFEIVITGVPSQPVSVRTTRQGRTDWGPVIGWTDRAGRWSTGGQFEKTDFGSWSEIWTVGDKLANPAIHFWVKAPCLPGGQGFAAMSGPNVSLTCDTTEGRQEFITPSLPDTFRTPDGRLIEGRASKQTQQQYQTEVLQDLITGGTGGARVALQSSRGALGDQTADLISTLIGVNALSDDETRHLLAIVQAAFEKPETIQPSARNPSRTLQLLLWQT
jgi:hypothetical protein